MSQLQTSPQTAADFHAHYRAVRGRIAAAARPQKLPSFGVPVIVTRKDRLVAIQREVARAHKITVDELLQDRRYACVQARYELFFRARYELAYTLTPLGQICGGVDHTTVRYGVGRVLARLARGERLASAPSITGVGPTGIVRGLPWAPVAPILVPAPQVAKPIEKPPEPPREPVQLDLFPALPAVDLRSLVNAKRKESGLSAIRAIPRRAILRFVQFVADRLPRLEPVHA